MKKKNTSYGVYLLHVTDGNERNFLVDCVEAESPNEAKQKVLDKYTHTDSHNFVKGFMAVHEGSASEETLKAAEKNREKLGIWITGQSKEAV